MGKYTRLARREEKPNPQLENGEKFVSDKLSYTYKHSILLDTSSNTGAPVEEGSTNLRTTNLTNLIASEEPAPFVWCEDEGYKLIKDGLTRLAQSHREAGAPEGDLSTVHALSNEIGDAFERRDAVALRAAVREWVEAGRAAFEVVAEQQREDVA